MQNFDKYKSRLKFHNSKSYGSDFSLKYNLAPPQEIEYLRKSHEEN
jgi:hypothetical protein